MLYTKRTDTYDIITYQCETEDGGRVDLTGASVNFVMGKKNKLITNAPAQITSAVDGIVSYQLTASDTLVSGQFLGEFEVTFPNGDVKHFPSNGYINVSISDNIDANNVNVVLDMIAAKQGDFEAKLSSILAQAGNVNMSSIDEYTWNAISNQVSYVFPVTSSYTKNAKWFKVYVGNIPVDDSLINRSAYTSFDLMIDPTLIKEGTKVTAQWMQPMAAIAPTSYKVIPQQSSPPVDAVEGDMWFDTSDDTYQGTVLEGIDTRMTNAETSLAQSASFVGVLIESYPALAGETDDSGRFNRALSALPNGKGVIGLSGKTYNFSTINAIPIGVNVIGVGMDVTFINHSGNNICFQFVGGNYADRGSIQNLTILGNSGANAVGIEIADQYGFTFQQVKVRNYTSGIGVRWNNKANWTEGTTVHNLAIKNCAVGLRLERNGGTNSFAYTRCFNLQINVPSNGIGIDFGGVSGQSIYVYHGLFNAIIWLDSSTNATAIQGRSGCNLEHSELYISGEGLGSTGQKSIVLGGASIKGMGFIRITNGTPDLSSGSIRVMNPSGKTTMDNMSGTDSSGNVFHSFLHQNVDDDTFSQFGYFTQSNVNSPYVSMFNAFGNAFSVISVDSGKKVSEGNKVFQVDRNGNLTIGVGGQRIYYGTGKPNGVLAAPIGSLYIRYDVTNGPCQLYVKTVDASNNNWAPIEQRRIGDKASRPTGVDIGVEYFDTDLKKPIKWDGLVWRDANSTKVWGQNQAFNLNDKIVTDNNYYQCTVAGTTGTTMPTATTGTTTDGTVTWTYLKSIV